MKDRKMEPEMDTNQASANDAAKLEERIQSTDYLGAKMPNIPERDLAAQYLDALQRERASFINYKRRVEQDRADTAQYAAAELLKKLLPVVDDFDRAIAAIPDEQRKGSKWVEGVELIGRKLHTILDSEGVERIESLDQPFDPNVHEAVAFEESAEGDDPTDRVSEVFSHGYRLKDRVLRPAMVKVTRG